MRGSWSESEVEAVVADYLVMLRAELCGESFNKTEHRRQLIPRLMNRTHGSIERKHQNISAILIEAGLPYVDGYKPLGNYQSLLRKQVLRVVESKSDVQEAVESDVESSAVVPSVQDILSVMESPPPPASVPVTEPDPSHLFKARRPINYLERESRNRSLGAAGEEFVVNYERARLMQAGKENLADRVERVSQTRGDGLGFDVLSYEPNGSDRFIEVKTTQYGKQTPFFISNNELRFASTFEQSYNLLRVFQFREHPKMYAIRGNVARHCRLDPTMCRASPG